MLCIAFDTESYGIFCHWADNFFFSQCFFSSTEILLFIFCEIPFNTCLSIKFCLWINLEKKTNAINKNVIMRVKCLWFSRMHHILCERYYSGGLNVIAGLSKTKFYISRQYFCHCVMANCRKLHQITRMSGKGHQVVSFKHFGKLNK